MLKIVELIEKLPPNLQEEVIDFIEFLIKKKAEVRKLENDVDIIKLKGIFNKYADPSKVKLEKEAWKFCVLTKWEEEYNG